MVDITMVGKHLLNSFTEQNDWNFKHVNEVRFNSYLE